MNSYDLQVPFTHVCMRENGIVIPRIIAVPLIRGINLVPLITVITLITLVTILDQTSLVNLNTIPSPGYMYAEPMFRKGVEYLGR